MIIIIIIIISSLIFPMPFICCGLPSFLRSAFVKMSSCAANQYLGHVKRKSAIEKSNNAQIQIILCKVSTRPVLSMHYKNTPIQIY